MPMSQAIRRPRRRIFIGYGIRKIAAIGLLLSNLWGTDPVQTQASDATLFPLPDRPEVPASIHTIAHYNLAIIEN